MSETEFEPAGHPTGPVGAPTADRMTDTVSNLAAKASEAVAQAGAAVRGATNDAARQAATTASDLGRTAYQRSERVGRDVVSQIEAQPLTAVFIAAVAGVCAGLLLARR
jgi:ElaB/YqjD/DUF883 family membrane-anchored ribosome-binding protein